MRESYTGLVGARERHITLRPANGIYLYLCKLNQGTIYAN